MVPEIYLQNPACHNSSATALNKPCMFSQKCWNVSTNPNEPKFFLLKSIMPKRVSPTFGEYGFIVSLFKSQQINVYTY